MGRYKLGKLPAVRPFGLKDLAIYAMGALPQPPASVDFYSGLSLPIYGNADHGDCVMCAVAHLLAAWDAEVHETDRKSTRLNSSHLGISYAVFCLKKKKKQVDKQIKRRPDIAGCMVTDHALEA